MNGKGREKNLKLWEVSAKDEKKKRKGVPGNKWGKGGGGECNLHQSTGKVWMVQRAEKFANNEKWRERSCYGREAFIWWKTRENTTVIIVETRSNDEKRIPSSCMSMFVFSRFLARATSWSVTLVHIRILEKTNKCISPCSPKILIQIIRTDLLILFWRISW